MSESITAILGLAQETIEHVTQQADRWIVTVQPPAPGPCPRCGHPHWHRHGRGPRRVVAHAGVAGRPVHLSWVPQR